MAKDIERNFAGTNFVVRVLAILVFAVVIGWIITHMNEAKQSDIITQEKTEGHSTEQTPSGELRDAPTSHAD